MELFQANITQKAPTELSPHPAELSQLKSLAMAAENKFDALALLKDYGITQADIERDLSRKNLSPNDRLVDTFLRDNFTSLSAFQLYDNAKEKSPTITKGNLYALELVTDPDGIKQLHEARINQGQSGGLTVGMLTGLGVLAGAIGLAATGVGLVVEIPVLVASVAGMVPLALGGAEMGRRHSEKAFPNEVNYYQIKEQQALQLTIPTMGTGKQ